MKFEGSQIIAADRMSVWSAINDPSILQQCIPGCEEMVKTSPTEFSAVVVQKVGPVKATFNGEITLEDIVEGEALTLRGEGKGGVAGMAKGSAAVRLTDVSDGTQLSYEADASVAGKIAQLGSRVIDSVGNRIADQFFARLKDVVEGRGTSSAADPFEPDIGDIDTGSVEGTTADDVWQTARDIASHGRTATATAGAAVGATAAAAAKGLGDDTDALAAKAGEEIGDAARNAAEHVEGAISRADHTIAEAVETARDSGTSEAAGQVETAVDDAQERVARSIADAKETLAGGIGRAKETAGNLDDGARQAVGDVAETVSETVSGTLDQAGDRFSAGAASAREAVSRIGDGAVDTANVAMAESAAEAQAAVTEVQSDAVNAAHSAAEKTEDGADWAKGAAVAAAGGVAAAVSGLASRAGEKLDDLHDRARDAVIDAGKDVDEAAEWSKAKTHAGVAVDEAGDALGDAWDAAKAKVQGASDIAAREWDEAKANAKDAAVAAGAAGSAAWTATKGHAAEEAQNPRIGPKGKPWYLWVILALVVFFIIWIVF